MSGFKMDDYVDVAERIREFSKRYPDGCLQAELSRLEGGWFARAYAYRSPEDTRPGIGHAFEPVPGKTPYTKDSEAMNAETSAWGRAIVALGFETKKIASAQEVRARQGSAGSVGASADSSRAETPSGSGAKQRRDVPDPPRSVEPTNRAPSSAPEAGSADGSASEFRFPSGKHQGKTLAEVPADYLDWYLANGPRDDVKDAIGRYLESVGGSQQDELEDVPF